MLQIVLLVAFFLLALGLGSVLFMDLTGRPDWLNHVFEQFKQPNFALELTLLILCAALLAAVTFYIEARKRRTAIVALSRWLKNNAKTDADFTVQALDFAAQIPQHQAYLVHAWNEFSKTLIYPEPTATDEGNTIRSTVRPASYFNLNATAEAGFNLSFWQAVPNYFVGFGLLCTFLGLVSGLHFAADGVAGADATQARESLRLLLNAATFKFLTSIAGVLASLFLSVFVRYQIQALQRSLDSFCGELEKRLIYVTPESIAIGQLREQKKLVTAMQRFNTDFAAQLAEAMEARFRKALTNPDGKNVVVAAIENLGETFKSNAGEMGKDVSESVLTGLSTPLKALTDAMAQLTDASAGAVDRVNDFSNTYSLKITQATERFEAGITHAAEEIKAAATAAAESVRQGAVAAGEEFGRGGGTASAMIDDAGRKMTEALAPLVNNMTSLQGTLSQVEKAFGDYDGRVGVMKSALDDSARSLQEVVKGFQSTVTALSASTTPVREAAAALSSSAKQSAEVSEAFKTTFQGIKTLADALTSIQSRLTAAWEQYRERFEDTDKKLAATFQSLVDGIGQTEKQVQSFVVKVDGQMSKAVSQLGSAVQDLTTAIDDMPVPGGR